LGKIKFSSPLDCWSRGIDRRKDRMTVLLIDAALDARAKPGSSQLANALDGVGVPLHGTIRLLTRPWERRRYQVPTSPEASSDSLV
jgi:hypothetical protein